MQDLSKSTQAYIDPKQVAIIEVVNHRKTNQNYIEALADAMRDVGFSAEYPVDVFRSENIPNHDLDPETTPYVVACGVHRTFAAQQAELKEIFATVHDGGEEAWVEMMHSDNFQFDPSQNRDIGQPFTPTERRSACIQLLFLPKYMQQTNQFLAGQWNTSESNVRRWKGEVAKLIKHNSPKLRLWGVSDGRVERLKTILASNERTNGQGEIVQVRKPRTDVSDDEKDNFFDKIRKDFIAISEESDIDFDWENVKRFCGEKWEIRVNWGMYKDLHIDQLRELHKMVLELNSDFVERCTAIRDEFNQAWKLKDDMEKACKKTQRMFCKLVGADNKYDNGFKSNWKTFQEIVKAQLNIEMFGHDRWDYDNCETAEERRAVIAQHETVHDAIKNEADWIAEFMKKKQDAAAAKRKSVSKRWIEKRQMAIDAINAYPREISFDRLISDAEKELYKTHGYFAKIFDAETVSDRKNIGTLEDEIKSMHRLMNAVENNHNWVADIPAVKKLIETLTDEQVPTEPEFTITVDDLHSISLDEIFQHVADRVLYLPVEDESEVKMDLATILGKASRGQVGTQLYLLMKYALFISPKRDEEGYIIEKQDEVSEEVAD